jgi:hypothetical protein
MNHLKTTLLLSLTAFSSALADDGWTQLFNGKDLTGWVQRGGAAKYTIEDGAIVGTCILDTPNSFLCTERDYADFVLEYEFKVAPTLNSGVQIRSHCFAEPTAIAWEGKVIKVPANRVHGYQIEIDPNPQQNRWWSAGIYEEAGRGWLFPGAIAGDTKSFTDQGRKIFKQNDWNMVRLEAIGNTLKTTLNGTPCASITDSMHSSGFIALQVHSISNNKSNEGSTVRWRNIRLKEVAPLPQNVITADEKSAGWKLLWDGKTKDGWRSAKGPEFPKAGWTIENGELLVGETGGAESAAAGDIITIDKYSDFELSVDFKITPGANSGIKIFVDPSINKGEGSAIGPEFQILDDERHPDAKLGKDGNRTIGSLYDLITAPANKRVYPPGCWNTAHIIAEGNHVTYSLNGVKTVDFERGSELWKKTVAASKYAKWENFGELKEGHILLQDHGNKVSYRNVKIRDFSKK